MICSNVEHMKFRIATLMLASLAAVCASLAGAETNSTRGFKGPAEIEVFVDGVIAAQLESLCAVGSGSIGVSPGASTTGSSPWLD